MSNRPDDEIRATEAYYHLVLERMPPRAEPAFETPEMQRRVWGRSWGVHNDVGRLRLCVLHRPGEEMLAIDPSGKYDATIGAYIDEDEQWYWRDSTPPDLRRMQEEHDALAAALRAEDVEVVYVDCPPRDPHAVFTRDVAVAVKGGAVIGRMGLVGTHPQAGRRGEEAYVARLLAQLGMPILHTIHGTGLLEGGSVCWLNESTVAIGMSQRQNEAGARQLEAVLAEQGVRLIRVPLPGYALHLDGACVMVDYDKALVNVTRLPYWFLETLAELGIQAIHVWPTEVKAVNCLAVRPGRVIMPAGCPRTRERLEQAGVEAIEVPYDEILKNGGGIHCSTLPLIRDP
ncbi:arginine deiminase family protein [Thermomicrobiaceae bacterium CFH 74404]|uniref:arginine deiminase n=1 Tax=Thermalbibacter longus TaxID=2951981 RepID=A0AA41WGP3_9BACT|nr:arginine deiminase family protein [Thermalbibacter longus]MCM8750085.1 arginine deiminase family protein [Thermalbibacter longus]